LSCCSLHNSKPFLSSRIIVRTTITLPLNYMLQFNTFLFHCLGWNCVSNTFVDHKIYFELQNQLTHCHCLPVLKIGKRGRQWSYRTLQNLHRCRGRLFVCCCSGARVASCRASSFDSQLVLLALTETKSDLCVQAKIRFRWTPLAVSV
jgi:hypothetical protein